MADKVPNIPAPTQRAVNAFADLGEIVVEVGDNHNRHIAFGPPRLTLRGWWKRENLLGYTMDQTMAKMPNIPGQCIVINCRQRVLRITDPLADPDNRELLQDIRRIYKEAFKVDGGPEKEYREEDVSDTRLKSWLWEVRKMLDNKQGRVLSGEVPSAEKIAALPGYRGTEYYNTSARARKYLEEDEREVAERNQMHVPRG